MKVPKRISTTLMNSLKGGVVPRIGLGYIAVGREQEIKALLNDVDIIEDGGATFRFLVGRYGSGKSFLLQTIRTHVMDRGFVVIDADLSPERRLMGTKGQGLATYKELIQNMSTKTKPDGQALSLILEKWISGIKMEIMQKEGNDNLVEFSKKVKRKIFENINSLEGMVHGFDFAKVINMYYEAYEEADDEKKSKVLKWFRGEYATKTECKNELGINIVITDDNWYEYIKIFAVFLVNAGYKGMLMLVDELVNLYRIPTSVTRQYNYEKILMMYNDTLQGKVKHLGIIMGGTPQGVEDTRKGIFSYDALRSRLTDGKFASEDTVNLLSPIIRLKRLTPDEIYILIEKLKEIHSELHDYKSELTDENLMDFIKIENERVGANTNITPREIIRDFIELSDILYQNPNKKFEDIIGNEKFEFAKGENVEANENKEFEDFEV